MSVSLTMGTVAPISAMASDKAVEDVYLGTPKYVYWETNTVGKWSSVKSAHEYQVKLYETDDLDLEDINWENYNFVENDVAALTTKRTTELSADFSGYMKDGHSYVFIVRAVPKTNERAYVESGEWKASDEQDFRGKKVIGETGGKWRNYLEGSKYETAEGTFLGSGWQLIQSNWYLLNDQGYRLTGWQSVDGVSYYLGDEGRMATGWFAWNENWYYADKNGAIQTGWVMTEPGKYYYLNADGSMAHDVMVEGYWLDSSGLRQSVQENAE